MAPLAAASGHGTLFARAVAPANPNFVPGSGTKAPQTFNNVGFMVLFALIGASLVIASLWFFFWAKNGGFHFEEGDWEEYKSTVLRRKGPDGKTLSNATKSTRLGGGSSIAGTQYHAWQKQMARSVIGHDEKGRIGIIGKRGFAGTHSVYYDNGDSQTMCDFNEVRTEIDVGHSKRYSDRDVAEYKREKPARVGGLNRVADGSHYGTSTGGSENMSDSSRRQIHQRDQERAERRAREEAARMERRWKREAEEAAAALARENERRPPPPPTHSSSPRKSTSPSKPSSSKPRPSSRSTSPKKRDFSYVPGSAAETLSTAPTTRTRTTTTQTAPTSHSTDRRSNSYYESYRPHAAAASAPRSDSSSRQSSPRKPASRRPREGGYRRGARSDLD
ncbi:hypothetical protein K470DRAFT_259350 [Piedraia hortae CBS 480.64]|uniref:Uncharacterized protein n=1 Tax=Piedraia hortae CBS 480.64 TaxID=1314780 RepID=A0A6A7BUT2_9PEZI|nr:hypothetical protein K470DRAFT_259350 [Piedraia hortae CBS 480.64]